MCISISTYVLCALVRTYCDCSLRREVCPDHSHCARVAPGNYTCVCDTGWTTTTRTTKTKPTLSGSGVALVCVPSKEEEEEKEEEEIHILLSVDAEDLIGLGAVVSSLLSHTARADLLRFHIALAELGEEEVKEYLMCRGLWREGKVGGGEGKGRRGGGGEGRGGKGVGVEVFCPIVIINNYVCACTYVCMCVFMCMCVMCVMCVWYS